MKRDRYEVRYDEDDSKYIVWDNETGEQAADQPWRFTFLTFAQSAADKMNGKQ